MSLGDKFKEHPIAFTAAFLGAVGGILTSIGTGINWVGQFVVSPSDLVALEERVTNKFTEEAVIIRTTYIADLTEKKAKLNVLLMKSTTVGEVALYQLEIKSLNDRIETLRGK